MRATRAIIHLENLRHNIRKVRGHIGPDVRMCMAVKADAYGHGVHNVVQIAREEGVSAFAIATVQEGIDIRSDYADVPVLLLSLPLPEEVPDIVAFRLTPLVADLDMVRALADEADHASTTVEVHLKVDTGMGRIGCRPEDALDIARAIAGTRRVRLAGICTHFPGADMMSEEARRLTLDQIRCMAELVQKLRREGIDPGLVHAANSGATIAYPQSHFDMVRPGIILYGYYPSNELKRVLDVKPVMEVESRVVFLKEVPKGTPISYGMTYVTDRATRIATIPIGYGDGYSRLLSGKSEVLIDGARYPLAGRVCMDQCMIDVGPAGPVSPFDRVTLFGPDPRGPSAEEIAGIIGTIPYEVTCGINKRVPRVYVDASTPAE